MAGSRLRPQSERDRTDRRDELKGLIREAIREEGFYARFDELTLPPLSDPQAELNVLAALLHGVIQKPFCGLEGKHFFSEAHQEVFARCHLPWDQVRVGLSGGGAEVNAFFAILAANCGPFAVGELTELAHRIIELHDQRQLIKIFRDLEWEMRRGKIQVCDAEHILQEHLLRDVTGP